MKRRRRSPAAGGHRLGPALLHTTLPNIVALSNLTNPLINQLHIFCR